MIIIVFGGLGSMTGTLAAAFAWALVLEGVLRLVLPQGFETWRYVVYPLLLLFMMLLRPTGLFGDFEMPFLRQLLPPLRRRRPPGQDVPPASPVCRRRANERPTPDATSKQRQRGQSWISRSLTKHFGGLRAVNNFACRCNPRRPARLDRPERRRQDHRVQHDHRASMSPPPANIAFNGQEITGLEPFEINQMGIARTFQNIRLFPNLTVLDNVRIAYHPHAGYGLMDGILHNRHFQQQRAGTDREGAGFPGRVQPAGSPGEIAKNLPYGEQRRLEIARALAAEPQLLLLDEPAAGMNPAESVVLDGPDPLHPRALQPDHPADRAPDARGDGHLRAHHRDGLWRGHCPRQSRQKSRPTRA